jgi:NTE family protein
MGSIKSAMEKKLAFVLSGGGSRGALQVGALRALFEAGYRPDLVAGTSIGAANAAFLGVHGYTPQGIQKLYRVWGTTIDQDLLPTNLWWHMMSFFLRRSGGISQQRVRDFAVSNGLTPELHFSDIHGIQLYLVAADLNSGRPVIFGMDQQDSILEGTLASMSIPPWISPYRMDGRYLMDGGAVSNLPIEAALIGGATEIIALDLNDPSEIDQTAYGIRPFLSKLNQTVEQRQGELELELAEARGVPVKHITLIGDPPVPFWDFRCSIEMMEHGYQFTRRAISTWVDARQPDA